MKRKPLMVELTNGKEVLSPYIVGNLNNELGANPTSAFSRTLFIGMYDGILGVDYQQAFTIPMLH